MNHDLFLSRVLAHYYRRRPVNATFTGVHEFDDRLPDWSPEGLEEQAAEMRALRSLAREADPPEREGFSRADADRMAREGFSQTDSMECEGFSRAAEVDRLLADAFLEIQLEEITGTHFQRRNPALFTGEALFGVLALVTREFAPVAARAESARSRLDRVPAFLGAAPRTITNAIPDLWRARAIRECEAAETFLSLGLPRYLAAHGVERDGDEALLRRARRAFATFREWIEGAAGEAGPSAAAAQSPAARVLTAVRLKSRPTATTPTRATCTSPTSAGEAFFSLLLRRGHFVEAPVVSLMQAATTEFEAARAALDERARAVDADGGWPAIQARLAASHPSGDDYVATFEREWSACRSAALDAGLVTWPDWPLRYVPIPEHTRDVAPSLYYLFYRSPAPFDPHVVPESLVTPLPPDLPADERLARLRANNRSVIRLNHVIHHGAIGHHVQNHFAYRSASRLGRVAAVDCASRIGMFCGGTMAEGWACYAVDLMDEIGYLSADEQVAQQHTRVRLLARAVLDIGLHVEGWNPEQGVTFWQASVGAPRDAAVAEVTRTTMFPGTAIMYWLGARAIHDLRRDWMRRNGASAALREFHDRLLSHGSIPVALVSKLMLAGALG